MASRPGATIDLTDADKRALIALIRAVTRRTRRMGRLVDGWLQVAVKVIDIFGNDTMTIVPVNVG